MPKKKLRTAEEILRPVRNAEAKLKPCPFCGCSGNEDHPAANVLVQEYGYLVVCWERCGAKKEVFSRLLKQVVAEWNHRRGGE
jgi:hypothetical protein